MLLMPHDWLEHLSVSGNFGFDLSDLQQQSDDLTVSMNLQAEELDREAPELNIKEYLAKVSEEFTEKSFMPLDDVWERELGDLLRLSSEYLTRNTKANGMYNYRVSNVFTIKL